MRISIALSLVLLAGCAGSRIVEVPGLGPEALAWVAGVQVGAIVGCDSTGTVEAVARFVDGVAIGAEEACQ